MADIINLQRKIQIDLKPYRSFLDCLVSSIPEAQEKTFSVAFISDRRMKQLNELFRGKNSTTDVLSFPHEPDPFDPEQDKLGDIVISAECAQKQAKENGLTIEVELKQLILHGLLHLCGMDHETDKGEMHARELRLRDTLRL